LIEIDGSFGEGGGQILRTALALSAILKRPFKIYNIRKGRKKPGLLAQHLTGVKAVAKITNAQVEGDKFNSLVLTFSPGEISSGDYEFNVAEERGSAGATTLVAQSILPILFFGKGKSTVRLSGGTHVPKSPIFDYLNEVLLPVIRNLGYDAEALIRRYGFYPVGGGEIIIKSSAPIRNQSPFPINKSLKRGEARVLKIVSRVANLPLSIAERQMRRTEELLKDLSANSPSLRTEKIVDRVSANCPGTYLFIKAEFSNIIAGFSSLGERGKPAEKVAEEAVKEFLSYYESDAVFDPHLADQILLFLALSVGKKKENEISFTTSRITNHLITNIWTIKKFLDISIDLVGELGKRGEIRIKL